MAHLSFTATYPIDGCGQVARGHRNPRGEFPSDVSCHHCCSLSQLLRQPARFQWPAFFPKPLAGCVLWGADMPSEKNLRGMLRSAVSRTVAKDCVVIVDSLNSIKVGCSESPPNALKKLAKPFPQHVLEGVLGTCLRHSTQPFLPRLNSMPWDRFA